VTFVARVGNDAFGAEAVRRYQAEGINTGFVLQDAKLPTGAAAIVVDDNAENSIVVAAGANGALTADDVRIAAPAIQSADAVLCQLETPLDANWEAFRLARAAGVLTILTPAPMTELPDDMLRLCDVCVPNRSEMELLVDRPINHRADVQAAAEALRARGVKSVAVTLGAEGVLLIESSTALHLPSIKVRAVDTTGAGDAFTAALAVFHAAGCSLQDAARQATAVAALTVTRVGAYGAFPSLAEVERWRGADS
jgi:ribokinase